VIPYDRALITAANLGRPFLGSRHPFSATARRMRAILADLEQLDASSQASNGKAPTSASGAPNDSVSPDRASSVAATQEQKL